MSYDGSSTGVGKLITVAATVAAAAGLAYCAYQLYIADTKDDAAPRPRGPRPINPLHVFKSIQAQHLSGSTGPARLTLGGRGGRGGRGGGGRGGSGRGGGGRGAPDAAGPVSGSPKAKAFDPMKKAGPAANQKPCAHCGTKGTNPKRCSVCKEVSYCTVTCQHAAWPKHKEVCRPPALRNAGGGAAAAPTTVASAAGDAAAASTNGGAPPTASSSGAPSGSGAAAAEDAAPSSAAVTPGLSYAAVVAEEPTTASDAGGSAGGAAGSNGVAHSHAAASGDASTAAAAAEPGPGSSSSATEAGAAALTTVATAAAAVSQVAEEVEEQSLDDALATYMLQAGDNKSPELEARLHRAATKFVRGELREAAALLAELQVEARQQGSHTVEGDAVKWLGHCHLKLSDVPAAMRCFEEGSALASEHGNLKLEVDCLSGLGMLYRNRNDHAKSVELLQRALVVCEGMEDSASRASVLCNLGAALMAVDQAKALPLLEEATALRLAALERVQNSGEPHLLATAIMEHASALMNLASAQYVMKQLPEARASYERALQVFEVVEDLDKVSKLLVNLSNMLELQMGSEPANRAAAANYRKQLTDFLAEHGDRCPSDECAICLDSMSHTSVSEPGKEIVILACCHSYHNVCWERFTEQHSAEDLHCPVCRQPVTLFGEEGAAGSTAPAPAVAVQGSLEDEVD